MLFVLLRSRTALPAVAGVDIEGGVEAVITDRRRRSVEGDGELELLEFTSTGVGDGLVVTPVGDGLVEGDGAKLAEGLVLGDGLKFELEGDGLVAPPLVLGDGLVAIPLLEGDGLLATTPPAGDGLEEPPAGDGLVEPSAGVGLLATAAGLAAGLGLVVGAGDVVGVGDGALEKPPDGDGADENSLPEGDGALEKLLEEGDGLLTKEERLHSADFCPRFMVISRKDKELPATSRNELDEGAGLVVGVGVGTGVGIEAEVFGSASVQTSSG